MKNFFLIFFLLIANYIAVAQDTNKKITLRELIEHVENKFNVKCFYQEEWLDKHEVTNSLYNSSIDSVLYVAFNSNNLLKYYIYQDTYVIFSEVETIDLRKNDIDYQAVNSKNQVTINNSENEKIIHQIGVPGLNEKVSAISGSVVETISKQKLPGVSIVADD